MYQLTKGEFCNYESYSAFNYHQEFTYVNGEVKSSQIKESTDPKYSTGLWENILQNVIGNDNKKLTLNITVCGLVGNICVMNTVHHGIAIWNAQYKNKYKNVKVNFIYSFPGTLFLAGPPPFNLPKANYQILKEIIDADIINNLYTDFNIIVKELGERVTLNYKIGAQLIDMNATVKKPNSPTLYGGTYYDKYLKYKQKYLELKNNI